MCRLVFDLHNRYKHSGSRKPSPSCLHFQPKLRDRGISFTSKPMATGSTITPPKPPAILVPHLADLPIISLNTCFLAVKPSIPAAFLRSYEMMKLQQPGQRQHHMRVICLSKGLRRIAGLLMCKVGQQTVFVQADYTSVRQLLSIPRAFNNIWKHQKSLLNFGDIFWYTSHWDFAKLKLNLFRLRIETVIFQKWHDVLQKLTVLWLTMVSYGSGPSPCDLMINSRKLIKVTFPFWSEDNSSEIGIKSSLFYLKLYVNCKFQIRRDAHPRGLRLEFRNVMYRTNTGSHQVNRSTQRSHINIAILA